MCYTVKINYTREELEKRFGIVTGEDSKYVSGDRISAFSLPLMPVISSDQPHTIKIMTWGLIPFWIRDQKNADEIRKKTFNAKCETLAEKPAFRTSYRGKRCIIPVNGFYEWQTLDKLKIPYYITLKHQPLIALAGLYDIWTNKETGEVINTFTIITTRANAMMEEIHNLKKRMPVILHPGNESKWLNVQTDPYKEKIFEPYDQNMMEAIELAKS